jgi:hypothetical protein
MVKLSTFPWPGKPYGYTGRITGECAAYLPEALFAAQIGTNPPWSVCFGARLRKLSNVGSHEMGGQNLLSR